MLNEFEDDYNLNINLIKKREFLDKIKSNKENINALIKENKELNKEININTNKYLFSINIILKLCSILFIIITLIGVGILSNFNFIVMLLFSVVSPVTCIFMKVYITELFKERYKKKNKKIICLDTLINENNIKIEELKKSTIKFSDCIIEIINNSHKEKKIVHLSRNDSRRKYCYTDSKNDHNIDFVNKNSGLKIIRKINNNKTRK